MTQSTSSGDDIETDDAGCHHEQAHASDIGWEYFAIESGVFKSIICDVLCN